MVLGVCFDISGPYDIAIALECYVLVVYVNFELRVIKIKYYFIAYWHYIMYYNTLFKFSGSWKYVIPTHPTGLQRL